MEGLRISFFYIIFFLFFVRVIPQESGGRSYRNQTYVMMSVVGDAVLVEYDQSSTAAGTSGIGEEEVEETQSVGGDYDSNE